MPNLTITSPTAGQSFKSGTAITVTASVTSASGPAPTGQMQFRHDGSTYGSPVTLSSGTASISITGLAVATHGVGAQYLGDTNYAPAGPFAVPITVTAVKIASTVALSQTVNAAGSCAAPQFAVHITGNPRGRFPQERCNCSTEEWQLPPVALQTETSRSVRTRSVPAHTY